MARRFSLLFVPLAALAALFFAWSAWLQANDPDPLGWMAVYGGAAALSLASVWTRRSWPLALVVGLGAALVALTKADALTRAPLDQTFSTTQMLSADVENAREALGLMLVSLWMGALVLHARRGPRAPRPSR